MMRTKDCVRNDFESSVVEINKVKISWNLDDCYDYDHDHHHGYDDDQPSRFVYTFLLIFHYHIESFPFLYNIRSGYN